MITLALPLAAVAPLAQTRTATVLSIGDGDTMRVREGNRTVNVRLACIDAPESSQAPFGKQARQRLQTLAPIGSNVELRIKATDRYGRSVAELTRSGHNLNQALVATGVAFVYWQYFSGCDRQTYGRLETEARLKRLGVWGVKGGLTRPWDYRSNQAAPLQPGRDHSMRVIDSQAGQRSCTLSPAVMPHTRTVAVSPCCKTQLCTCSLLWRRSLLIPEPCVHSPTAPAARPAADRCA